MFKREGNEHEIVTVIGPSVQVEGDFVADGDVVIEGIVSGTIRTARNLRIGPGAKVYANVTAANALIAGEVQGDLTITHTLELTDTAKVFGDITAKQLSIGSGAVVHGEFSVGDKQKSKFEKIEDWGSMQPAADNSPKAEEPAD